MYMQVGVQCVVYIGLEQDYGVWVGVVWFWIDLVQYCIFVEWLGDQGVFGFGMFVGCWQFVVFGEFVVFQGVEGLGQIGWQVWIEVIDQDQGYVVWYVLVVVQLFQLFCVKWCQWCVLGVGQVQFYCQLVYGVMVQVFVVELVLQV